SNLMGDETLRARLAANAEANVRRYDAEHILSQWDAVALAAREHTAGDKTEILRRAPLRLDA
ncbi:hypothetical protein SAMN05216459_1221, partial [Ensifer sp. OV372]